MHQERRRNGCRNLAHIIALQTRFPLQGHKPKSSLFIIFFPLSLSCFFIFTFFSCGFLSVGYGHATRHRWFVTAQRQSYLVVVVVVAWVPCGALPNAKVHCGAIFVCCHCDDKATEKAKEEEGMTEYNEKGGGKKK
jgi:hypothetical protein